MRDEFYNNNNNGENNLQNDESLKETYDFTLVNSPESKTSEDNNSTKDSQTASDYNYWKAQVEEQTPKTEQTSYQAPAYGYDSDNFSQSQTESTAFTVEDKEVKDKKQKKGFGRTLGRTAAIAAVFGLVAGGVFQGTNLAVSHFNSSNPVTIESTKTGSSVTATTTSSKSTSSTDDTSVANLVENAMPSIVSITSTVEENINYFGRNLSQQAEGSGSGIIVGQNDNQLLIATNNHVIDGAKTISVCFIDNEVVEAEVKGTDSSADLAVVAVNVKDIKESTLKEIKVATLGDSDDVKVGEMAVAIGNALGYGQSVTVGYISAKDRQVAVENSSSKSSSTSMKLLQTDAAINPGNSGGALLNLKGEVIGINSVKYASTDVEGMGYAIPISTAIPIINDLMNREVLTENEKGYLGITGTDITENNNIYNMPTGVYVYEVAKDSAAEEGGMKVGDIIVKINDREISSIEAVKEKVNSLKVGTKITVVVKRNDNGEYKEVKLNITLKGSGSLSSLDNNSKNSDTTTQNNQQAPNSSQDDSQSYSADDIFKNFIENFGN
ncbi:S1C family serine protease [Velocimicrobium porci]|uniref:PDZ domain-containing protein n=1 Tax=Velocimicrobium porci TaxID=2606634 RepID=A0A6L5XVE4_9FIRM|nr:trypsin-like peptidase domain-containing protein [Velocimicrobium porci]MSS62702.1 PDZ domain-containing protein [Velocimicrobium porci]